MKVYIGKVTPERYKSIKRPFWLWNCRSCHVISARGTHAEALAAAWAHAKEPTC